MARRRCALAYRTTPCAPAADPPTDTVSSACARGRPTARAFPGIVYEDMRSPELTVDSLKQLGDACLAAHIELLHETAPAGCFDLPCGLFGAILIGIEGNSYICTFHRKGLGYR